MRTKFSASAQVKSYSDFEFKHSVGGPAPGLGHDSAASLAGADIGAVSR